MTLLLQLVALWSVLSVLVAVGCSLLFRGAEAYAQKAARRPVEPETPAHLAA
jgi:hypothetical protein